MDNFFRQQGSVAQRLNGFLAGFPVLGSILNWASGFIRLTEEDLENAGIYFGE